MSAPSSWSAVAAANASRPKVAGSACWARPPMAIATSALTRVGIAPGSRSSWRRPAWCGRSSPGLATSAAPSARSAGACKPRACGHGRASRCGTTRRFGICCATRRTGATPPSAARARLRCSHACAPHADGHHFLGGATRCARCRRRSGFVSLSPRWWMRICLPPSGTNCARTSVGRTSQPRGAAICCRDYSSAPTVAMPIAGARMTRATPTIGAAARMPPASAGPAFATIKRCGWTGSIRRSGRKSAGCLKSRSGWSRSIASVCIRRRTPTNGVAWTRRSRRSAGASRA